MEGMGTLRSLIATIGVALCLAICGAAHADTTEKETGRTVQAATSGQLTAIWRKSHSTVNWWNHQGRWALHLQHNDCSTVQTAKGRHICAFARRSLAWHTARAERARARMWSVLPAPADWTVAVRVTQRAFPGTERWLLSCSASEGGHGRWVPNRKGSGAGGWMQFMESTFWRMYRAAERDATNRGFVVPASAASYYSPIGQALAGAWGVTHGRSREWAGSGC